MIFMHHNAFKRPCFSRTQFQIKSPSAVVRTNYTVGPHAKRARTSSIPIRRTIVDKTTRVQPGRRIDHPHAMNYNREWPSLKPEDRPQNQPPVEKTQRRSLSPRAEHTPNTKQEEERVYVLTLKTTESLALPMNEFRERYFPKRLNRTPAHLTLFHALPHSQFDRLDRTLTQTSSGMGPFHVSAGKPFRMRLGVGINVGKGYNKMKNVHELLQSQWLVYLSEQDAGGFRPHWTAMNKVNDEKKVNEAFDTIQGELLATDREGQALGLVLWNYNGGNWELAKEYMFGSAKSTQTSG